MPEGEQKLRKLLTTARGNAQHAKLTQREPSFRTPVLSDSIQYHVPA